MAGINDWVKKIALDFKGKFSLYSKWVIGSFFGPK